MLAPGVPYGCGPAAHRPGVFLRRGSGDVGDRDLSAGARDRRLFDLARPREPALDALVHLLRAVMLDRDRDAGQVRCERTAGEDVPVVLTGIAIDQETPHRGVARVLERAKTEIVEELLTSPAAAHPRAALGTGIEVDGRSSGASPPAARDR